MGIFADRDARDEETSTFSRFKTGMMPKKAEIEGTGYKRRVIDRRIEKHLDRHFNDYIERYDLIRELHLREIEDDLEKCEPRIKDVDEFQKDIKAEIEELERDLEKIEEEVG
ncbi:MAG: hypothetical protein ACLFSM_00755 [Thermoplasmata archaeon]